MALVERNHVVQQVATAASHPALGYTILPRASERSSDGLQFQCFHGIAYCFSEFCITVQDQVFVMGIIGKSFAQLLRDPETGRMPGDVAVQNAPAIMSNDKEAVQDSKGECRNREEVHCCDGFTMILQEDLPTPGRLRILRCALHPAGDGPFRDIET